MIRLVCRAGFRTKDGFTEARHAIVDTGAHTSVLPLSLWKRLDIKMIGEHYVGA
ncbi:MAG: retropepsin-like domain-containing protein [Euryarchaeota archaeon]|nr:retropepsin-like domain-containing protein [Euryarchaeota archaeon]